MQRRLKSAARSAGTQVIATELFDRLFLAAPDAFASFDLRLARISK